MTIGTYRIGTPRKRGEGLRLGAVRFLPRGVKKGDYARLNLFDVWLPQELLTGKNPAGLTLEQANRRDAKAQRFARTVHHEGLAILVSEESTICGFPSRDVASLRLCGYELRFLSEGAPALAGIGNRRASK
jgi:uncharacterized protein DUF488